MNDIKITCHHFYGAACILIYANKNLGRGSPLSAMAVAHFTPPSGREGNTPPHPHPRGVTMHLAPETTMMIRSWLTDDSPPGSQMLLIHTMLPTWMLLSHTTLPTWMLLSHTTLPTWMLLSHTTLPPGSRCHSLVTTAYRTWGFSNTLLTAPWVGLTKYTLYATSPGSHVASLPSSPGWGTINIQWSATFPWVLGTPLPSGALPCDKTFSQLHVTTHPLGQASPPGRLPTPHGDNKTPGFLWLHPSHGACQNL